MRVCAWRCAVFPRPPAPVADLPVQDKSRSSTRQEHRIDPVRADMTQAYIIEIENRTAGIVARDDRGYRFFSSDRTFDGLEGHEFRSARDAERAARTLLQQRRHLFANPSTASAF
jgi:hypothetical protein